MIGWYWCIFRVLGWNKCTKIPSLIANWSAVDNLALLNSTSGGTFPVLINLYHGPISSHDFCSAMISIFLISKQNSSETLLTNAKSDSWSASSKSDTCCQSNFCKFPSLVNNISSWFSERSIVTVIMCGSAGISGWVSVDFGKSESLERASAASLLTPGLCSIL